MDVAVNDLQVRAVEAVKGLQKGFSVMDNVVNVIEAALTGLPIPGAGAFASLMKDYLPNRRAQRVIAFAEVVADDLRAIAARIDACYVKSDEFAYLFERCFKGVIENYQEEKLAAFRAIITNALLQEETPAERKELYLQLAGELAASHIRVLQMMYQRKKASRGLISEQDLSDGLPTAMPGERLMIIDRLQTLGLLTPPLYTTNIDPAAPACIPHDWHPTDVGWRFLEFITLQPAAR